MWVWSESATTTTTCPTLPSAVSYLDLRERGEGRRRGGREEREEGEGERREGGRGRRGRGEGEGEEGGREGEGEGEGEGREEGGCRVGVRFGYNILCGWMAWSGMCGHSNTHSALHAHFDRVMTCY